MLSFTGFFFSQSLPGVCLLFCLTNVVAPFCVRVTGVVAVSSVQWVCPALSWVHFLGASSVCRVTFGSVPSGPFMKLIGSFSCSPPGIRPRSWLFRVLGFVRVRSALFVLLSHLFMRVLSVSYGSCSVSIRGLSVLFVSCLPVNSVCCSCCACPVPQTCWVLKDMPVLHGAR